MATSGAERPTLNHSKPSHLHSLFMVLEQTDSDWPSCINGTVEREVKVKACLFKLNAITDGMKSGETSASEGCFVLTC